MLRELESWFRENELMLKECSYAFSVSTPITDTDKNSVYVDIEAEPLLARVTLWESGECEREAIHMETEKRVLYEYSICQTPEELFWVLERFLKSLGCIKE